MQFNTDFDRKSSYSMDQTGGGASIGNSSSTTNEFEPDPISQQWAGIHVVSTIDRLPSSLIHNSDDYLVLLSQLSQTASSNPFQGYTTPSAAAVRGQSFSQGVGDDTFSMDLEPAPILGRSDNTSMDRSLTRASGTPPISNRLLPHSHHPSFLGGLGQEDQLLSSSSQQQSYSAQLKYRSAAASSRTTFNPSNSLSSANYNDFDLTGGF